MMRRAFCIGLCAVAPLAVAEDSATLNLRAQAEARELAEYVAQYGAQSGAPVKRWENSVRSFQLAELRWQMDAPLQSALRGVFTARHDSGGDDTLRVNELSLERPLGAGFATVGKKVMSWDVGYAFRPLDVVQQEDRRVLNPVTLEGVAMLAWEVFDAERAITIVLSNPGKGREAQPRDDGSLAVRLYRQNGARDEYAVLRLSQRNGAEGGVSFSQVATEALELHASILFQQRHDDWIAPRIAAPFWRRHEGGGKALAGFTWTTESKFSFMGEAWLDRTAAASQQRNLLLRAAQTEGDFDIAADVLWQPGRGGNSAGSGGGSRIASVSASWKPGPWLLSASWRHYGGVAGTAVRNVAIATLQYAF